MAGEEGGIKTTQKGYEQEFQSSTYVDKVHFCAGISGGAAGVLAGHPLDTVKVRLQTQTCSKPIYNGMLHCFSTIIKQEGFRGLYKGMTSPIASLAFINAMVFGVHGLVNRQFEDRQSMKTHFLSGCAAGMSQAIIASPSERLKLLIQIQNDAAHTVFRSPIHAAREIVKQHGVAKLFRGFWATLLRDCPAFGIYFASYEWMARKMSADGKMESLSSPQLLLAGGGAGMLSWLFNYPTDVIKTRFQANETYTGYWDCIQRTYKAGGYRAFGVGLGSTLVRAFPTNAATFFVVEWTYRILLDFNILGISQTSEQPQHRHIMTSDLWSVKCEFLLPEAGSTSIDPMIHGCRFI